MKRIRIGKDIEIHWPILTNGEQVALEGRDLKLFVHLPSHMDIPVDFTTEGNTAIFTISGTMQKSIGVYRLTMWENLQKRGQTAVDYCKAFELVPTTLLEGGEDESNLTTETVDLEASSLVVGLPGESAYEAFKKYNPNSELTEEEYAEAPINAANAANEAAKAANDAAGKIGDIDKALAEKVDKEEGKGLSTNDYTDQEKEKLAGLSNYDDTEIRKELSDKVSKKELTEAAAGTLTEAKSYTDTKASELWNNVGDTFDAMSEELNSNISGGDAQALTEAKRCLDCANPGCTEGCPVGIDIPRFIKNIERGEFLEAAKTLKETSALPAVCGRVCPQEKQCESKCIHLKMNEKPVAIGYLERFAADYERESGQISVPEIKEKNGIKVAVIGSGPAGLSFAGDMAKYGYDVTVFEALHEIGGVLKYGIPEFRLPNKVVDVEIDNLAKMGVEFVKDCIIGKTLSVEQLEEEGFKGIFVASGAGLPNFMNIPGENSINILSSNEYLTRVNLMDAASEDSDTPVPFGKCVAVIGGGNTAMDSVRTARRLGAERAMIIYRRSEEEMPARIEEVKHAKEEGVEFLHNPIEYIADEQGKVKQVVLQKMELGEPDASGRRSPVPIPGATETIDIDLAIVSVGVSPNPIVPSSIKGLELGRKGTIAVNDNMQSSIPTIFAGGDIVRGGATVILAMGDGRKAAAAMNEQLKK